MLCPKCKVEMRISRTAYRLTSDTPPKLFVDQEMRCRSRQCSNYDKVVDTISTEIPLMVESAEEETTEEAEETTE